MTREEDDYYLEVVDQAETNEIVKTYFCLSLCNGILGLERETVSERSIRHIDPFYILEDNIPDRYFFPSPLPDMITGISLDNGQKNHLGSYDLIYTLGEAEQRRNKDMWFGSEVEIFSVRDFTDKVWWEKEGANAVEEQLERYKCQISRERLSGRNIKYGLFILQEEAFKLKLVPPRKIPIVPYKKQEKIEITLDQIETIEKKYLPRPDERSPPDPALFITFQGKDGTRTTLRVHLGDLRWLQILRVPAEKFILNQDKSE